MRKTKRKKQTNRAITRRFNRKVRKLTPYAKLKEDYEALRTASDMQDGDIEHLQSRIRDYERIIAAKSCNGLSVVMIAAPTILGFRPMAQPDVSRSL